MADISKEMALVIGAKHSTPTQFGREFSEAQWMAAVQDIAKLGRNAGLEEAAQELKGVTGTHPMVLRGIVHAVEIIEELKG